MDYTDAQNKRDEIVEYLSEIKDFTEKIDYSLEQAMTVLEDVEKYIIPGKKERKAIDEQRCEDHYYDIVDKIHREDD